MNFRLSGVGWKRKDVRCRVESESLSSESDVEEGQKRNYGLTRGECFKAKVVGKEPKLDGPKLKYGQKNGGSLDSYGDGLAKECGSQASSEDGLQEPNSMSRPADIELLLPIESPTNHLIRQSDRRVVSVLDKVGRAVSIPLKGPIQPPLSDVEGGQINGKDLAEVPLAVEIAATEHNSIRGPSQSQKIASDCQVDKVASLSSQSKNRRSNNQDTEREVVLDRSMKRIGRKNIHLVKRHSMITRNSKAVALDLNHDFGKENLVHVVKKASWNLKEEIAKVIKAGVVLGFDVNGRENDMVEEIVRRIKTGTFGKPERILSRNNN